MSNELTWADVAHHYFKSKPDVVVMSMATSPHRFRGKTYFPDEGDHYGAKDLPVLRELDDMTEEEATAIAEMMSIKPMFVGVWTNKEILFQGLRDVDFRVSGSLIDLARGNATVVHYLISRQFNIFGVQTYKEANQ